MDFLNIYPIDKEEYGIGLWIWIGTLDDIYFTVKEFAQKHNYKRKRRFCIHTKFIKWNINLEIPIKTIGWNKK